MGTLSFYKGFTVNFLCGRPSGLRLPSGTGSGRRIATTKAVLYMVKLYMVNCMVKAPMCPFVPFIILP